MSSWELAIGQGCGGMYHGRGDSNRGRSALLQRTAGQGIWQDTKFTNAMIDSQLMGQEEWQNGRLGFFAFFDFL